MVEKAWAVSAYERESHTNPKYTCIVNAPTKALAVVIAMTRFSDTPFEKLIAESWSAAYGDEEVWGKWVHGTNDGD